MKINRTCNNLQSMNGDLLADILGRVDGLGLASVACTCSDLQEIAHDPSLWKQLCHSTWPSTALHQAEPLLASSTSGGGGGFDKFYADSYPLILYDSVKEQIKSSTQQTSPSEFVSLVDVYWDNKCVLSKVLDGIPDAVDTYGRKLAGTTNWGMIGAEREEWFLNFPFKLELLQLKEEEEEEDDDHDHDQQNEADDEEDHLQFNQGSNIGMVTPQSLCHKIVEDLRLSWILLDKKVGKAVNLSSGKPLLVQKSWPYQEDYVAHFGSIIPVEESVLPHKLAKCIIKAHFKVKQGEEGDLQWREISLGIEDIRGAHVNGRNSLAILNQALYSFRSTNQEKVALGFLQYEKQKKEMIRKLGFREKLADGLCISIEIAILSFLIMLLR